MTAPLSRLQWGMRGIPGQRGKRPVITAYDAEGGFAFRLEQPREVEFFTNLIFGGIAKLSEEREKQRAAAQTNGPGVQPEEPQPEAIEDAVGPI